MKRILFVFSIVAALVLASCSTKYDGEKAAELCTKCKSGDFTESDAKQLLDQYEACWSEFIEMEKKVDEGDDPLLTDYRHLNKGLNEMGYTLQQYVGQKFPEIQEKARQIETDYLKKRLR